MCMNFVNFKTRGLFKYFQLGLAFRCYNQCCCAKYSFILALSFLKKNKGDVHSFDAKNTYNQFTINEKPPNYQEALSLTCLPMEGAPP